jgi:chloride channel 2
MTKYVAGMYNIYVEDFMVREVRYIWHGITFGQLKDILKDNRNLRSFPLVDSPGIYSNDYKVCHTVI